MTKKCSITSVLSITGLLTLFAASTHAGSSTGIADHVGTLPDGPLITESDIKKAQHMWGEAVVNIGPPASMHQRKPRPQRSPHTHFELGTILFKPTLAADQPFRPDLEGTLSYFISGNPNFKEDVGFALKPWSNVRFDNHSLKIFGNKAIAMGHYFFTSEETGKETKVEYTKGYIKLDDGRVLLFLQDSSLPYQG